MEKEVLVDVKNVSKKFCKDLKTSLRYGLQDSFRAILPGNNAEEKTLRKKEFWAVQNISFTLRRGECIGLIGHNGAGKSSLLKMINGLINPDAGKIQLKGKIGALIELGAGFNPILTGRENIYNNAAVLGFSKKEIDAKMDAIIAFSEIEEFLDMPVQNYSSGMKVRLGFAVAAHLEPDVLIVDEVLAVGDLGFVLKCFKAIDELLPNTAMIFVSHNMPMVSRICNQIILMEKGEVKYQGEDVSKGIDLYYNRFSNSNKNVVFTDNSVELVDTKIIANNRQGLIPMLKWNEDLEIILKLKFKNLNIEMPYISLSIFDKENRGIAYLYLDNVKFKLEKTLVEVHIKVENIKLSKGTYNLNLLIQKNKNNSPKLRVNNIQAFQIDHELEIWQSFLLDTKVEFK